jgi:hypothetical protein
MRPSCCLCVCMCMSPNTAIQRLSDDVPKARNIWNSIRTVERVVFYEVRVVSKDSGRLVLPRMKWWYIQPHEYMLVRGKVEINAVLSMNKSHCSLVIIMYYNTWSHMKIKLPWKRGCKISLWVQGARDVSRVPEGVHWSHLAQDSDQQRDLLNTTKNLRVTYKELENLD